MLAPVYYVVLDTGRKLCEIGAEAAYSNNKVFVFFRILFGRFQFIGVYNVVLDVRAAIQHESICIGNKLVNALFTLHDG